MNNNTQLNKINTNTEINSNIPQIRPFIRLFARIIDCYVYTLFAGFKTFVITFLLPEEIMNNFELNSKTFFLIYLYLILTQIFYEAIIVSFFGTTLGKFTFSIYLRNNSNNIPNFKEALKRSFYVMLFGLAFYIALLSFITLIISYYILTHYGKTPWDRSCNITVIHKEIKTYRIFVLVIISLAILALAILVPNPDKGLYTLIK